MSIDTKERKSNYYQKNKERHYAKTREWIKNHPEKAKEYQKRYREKMALLPKEERQKNWNTEMYKENKEKWREEHSRYGFSYSRIIYMKREYKISVEDVVKLLEKQKGRCAICKTELFKKRKLCIDHNHDTGEVRGLLCQNCNLGIGQLKDSFSLVTTAASYLLKGGTSSVIS